MYKEDGANDLVIKGKNRQLVLAERQLVQHASSVLNLAKRQIKVRKRELCAGAVEHPIFYLLERSMS